MANKYLILLVEDESNIASFITTVLRANQYEVKRAATGEEALMMASSYCPDLIILDLCKRYEVPVVMNTDAHASFMVGDLTQAIEVVEEAGFPEELILNDSVEKFKRFLNEGRKRSAVLK